jgi:uncharacterized membrane protein YvbJ
MTKKTKQIAVIFIIIIIAFVIFKMFFSGTNSSNTTLVADKTNSAGVIDGQKILVLLNNLNKVTLDDSIFSNKIFTSLISFEKPIADQVPGRKNPFLPIGTDNSATNLSGATTTLRATSTLRAQ